MDPLMLIGLGAKLVFMYFFMIRPENKKKANMTEMRDSLSVGDSITTIGGIMGKVVHVDDEKVTFETSEDRVRIQVVKSAISTVGKKSDKEA